MRLSDMPLVSILMPCLNAAKTIAEAIQSVQKQTLQDWELLVADDASSDESCRLIQDMAAEDSRIVFLDHATHQTGAAATRNRALSMAKGRYIAFLDADDLWMPRKLDQQLAFMKAHGAAFSHTSYVVRRGYRADYVRTAPVKLTRETLLRGNRIGCLTVLYDTMKLGKQPMPEIPKRHDYALWLHLLNITPFAVGLPQPLAIHQRKRGSLSANPFGSTYATFSMLHNQAGLTRSNALNATSCHVAGRLIRG